MQGLQKSKSVSWASDGNLCQVRLFLSEESPSQVGLGAQDHLQAKKVLSGLNLNGLVADDNLPPGFEGFSPANQLKNQLAQIPLVKWQRPPKFILDVAWQVVNGEESKEVEIQNQRELRVLEAYYPRQSAIPPNPAISPDIEGAIHDQPLQLIPMTPIEDDDSLDPATCVSASMSSNPSLVVPQGTFSPSQSTSPNYESGKLGSGIVGSGQQDILKAALTAVAKSNEQIDHDLLVKILSNPTILEQIVRPQGTGSGSGSGLGSQLVASKPMDGPRPGAPMFKMDPPPLLFNKVETGSSSSTMISNGPLYPYPNGTGPMPYQQSGPPGVPPQVPPAPHKDLNYYKNLIQKHGGEKQAEPLSPFTTHPIHHSGIMNQDAVDNSKPRDTKPKIMKPCMYFNSSKGCRHGANCVYQHDISFQQRVSSIPEMQSAKRMKMDRD